MVKEEVTEIRFIKKLRKPAFLYKFNLLTKFKILKYVLNFYFIFQILQNVLEFVRFFKCLNLIYCGIFIRFEILQGATNYRM